MIGAIILKLTLITLVIFDCIRWYLGHPAEHTTNIIILIVGIEIIAAIENKKTDQQ